MKFYNPFWIVRYVWDRLEEGAEAELLEEKERKIKNKNKIPEYVKEIKERFDKGKLDSDDVFRKLGPLYKNPGEISDAFYKIDSMKNEN